MTEPYPAGRIPVSDRGLNYGDGLFETMRLSDGVVPLLELHLERLAEGCRRLALTPPPADLLVVGLGNPGSQYEGTRHNIGVEVVLELCERHGGRLRKSKELALADELRIGGRRVAVAFPQTYMNESGRSVGSTRSETLPTSSRSSRSLTRRAVSLVPPERPASGRPA